MRVGFANSNGRVRVSKDGAAVRPSCFETPRHSAWKTRVDALKARLLSMRGITIARAGCFAKQGCGFSLFSSCSVLLSTVFRRDVADAARADFPFASRSLRQRRGGRLWPAAESSP